MYAGVVSIDKYGAEERRDGERRCIQNESDSYEYGMCLLMGSHEVENGDTLNMNMGPQVYVLDGVFMDRCKYTYYN